MIILDKIISFIKKIFYKEELKKLEEVKNTHETKSEFIKSLKIHSDIKNKKIKTLICVGDGLGIRNEIKY